MKRTRKSKPLTARISEADETWLWSWFAGYVEQAMKRYDVEAFEILHPRLHKRKPVVRARRDIVLAMRESVWWRDTTQEIVVRVTEASAFKPGLFIRRKAVREIAFGKKPIPADWQPISYPMLASLFVGCDHTAMLYIHRKAVERRRAAAAEQSITEASDDRNRDSDRNGVDSRGGDCGGSGQSGAQSVERAGQTAT